MYYFRNNIKEAEWEQMTYYIYIYRTTHPKEAKTKQKKYRCGKKAYDMVPQTWIIECLKMYKISTKIINFITNATEN